VRRKPTAAVAALATGLALYPAWHSGGHVWRRLNGDYHVYHAYTPADRQRAFITALPLPASVFDFYAQRVKRGDRVYYNVMESGFGSFFTLPEIVAAVGRFYLLPAVQVTRLRDATVVLSWFEDPSQLHIHFPIQSEAGLQPFYVSRIKTP
jgi:hypothetical protein